MSSDDDILDMIFNPELQGVGLEGLKQAPPLPPPAIGPIDSSLLSQLRAMESRAISLAESGSKLPLAPPSVYDEPLRLLGECIALCSRYASAYNNRAQVLQLAKRPEEALLDCDAAIEHATAAGDRTTLMQSHTQRGLLRRTLGQQEGALADLERGGSLGNLFAKTEAVRLNPYAALCNQYLQQAIEKQWSGLSPLPPMTPVGEQELPPAAASAASVCAATSCSNPPETAKQPAS